MHWLRMGLTAAVAMLMLAGLVVAQAPVTPKPAATPAAEPPKEKASPPDLPRELDPTIPGPRLKAAMDQGKTQGAASRLPDVILRGRVFNKDRPATAMLEIDKKLYVVSKGSAVLGPGKTVLKIIDLTKNEIRIEISPFNETITLR